MDKVICPRCGAENLAGAMNCTTCRINLSFALTNPTEIERIKQKDARADRLDNVAWVENIPHASASKGEPVLLPVLLLFWSFVFAFNLGGAVHEMGHYLAHRAYGFEVKVILDPFGGSRTLGSSSPQQILGITSLAGPLLNLLIATVVFLLLWWKRRPALLPLLLWAPLALVQEGVAFSLGMLTPGGDADLIVRWGVPSFFILAAGILFLAVGVAMLCWVLPLANLSPDDSPGRKIIVILSGMASFMLIRFFYSGLFSPDFAQSNAISLIFSLLLATVVSMLYEPLHLLLSRISQNEPATVT